MFCFFFFVFRDPRTSARIFPGVARNSSARRRFVDGLDMIDSRLMNGRPLCPSAEQVLSRRRAAALRISIFIGIAPAATVGKLRSMGPINYGGFASSDIYMCYAVSFATGASSAHSM